LQLVSYVLRAHEGDSMTHEVAKLMLEHADTFLKRAEAIQVALDLGMPLHEIEAYLDWLDAVRGDHRRRPDGDSPNVPSTR
jgi:hypothetical protein